jgi:hypothetical protein
MNWSKGEEMYNQAPYGFVLATSVGIECGGPFHKRAKRPHSNLH